LQKVGSLSLKNTKDWQQDDQSANKINTLPFE